MAVVVTGNVAAAADDDDVADDDDQIACFLCRRLTILTRDGMNGAFELTLTHTQSRRATHY